MELLEARRLTGANWLWAYPGAILEVALGAGEDADEVARAWRTELTAGLEALSLEVRTVRRDYPGGMSLAFAAPIDALYSAVSIGELAWAAAQARLSGEPYPNLAQAWKAVEQELIAERSPRLVELAEEAARRGINLCGDDEWTTLGMGAHGQTYDTTDLPEVTDVDWDRLADVPCAMVTGTNGKSTTVRMLVAMAQADGRVPGASSTDWIQVGDELLDKDDWSGPGGARAVLKDPRVEVAILETARGGLLRRGLAVPRVDVAVIINVATDHMGEMGVHSLSDLTEVKFVVRRAAEHLVLNADDPEVRRRGSNVERPVTWVSLDAEDRLVREHQKAGGRVALVENGILVLCDGTMREDLLPVERVPVALGGAARYNLTNALCAAAAAWRMGLSFDAIRAGLAGFESDPIRNPGRLNSFDLGGVHALVDFAHNPHGMRALFELADALPHQRLAVLLGQAGDRDDASIIELAQITAETRPDLVVVKHMTRHLRGRAEGEVVRLIDQTLRQHGLASSAIQESPSELEAARDALTWAQPGDLLLLLCHAERDEVLELLQRLQRENWQPGSPLP